MPIFNNLKENYAIPAPVSVKAAELLDSRQGICSPDKVPQALRCVSSSFMPPKKVLASQC